MPPTTNTDDDHRLATRLGQRDEQAMAEVYSLHGELVRQTAARVVLDRRAAEDITQEVFIHLWRHADRVDLDRGTLRAYLVTIARRRAIDHVRSEESRRRREDGAARRIAGGQPDIAPDPADEVAATDARAGDALRVRAAIGQLPTHERTCIELAYFRGRTLREVAVDTGTPEGTAKARVRRALRKMEMHLTNQVAGPAIEGRMRVTSVR